MRRKRRRIPILSFLICKDATTDSIFLFALVVEVGDRGRDIFFGVGAMGRMGGGVRRRIGTIGMRDG